MDPANDARVASHERSVYASAWVMFGFTVIAMALRFWSRIARRSLGWDDWSMLAGWLLYLVSVVLLTIIVDRGSLRHIQDIALPDLIWILKISNILQVFAMWSQTLAKVSIGLLIPRVLGANKLQKRTYFVYANLVVYVLSSLANSILLFFECDPPRALWEINLVQEGKATCPRVERSVDLTFFQSSFGIWMDFLLAAIPATVIYKLHMPIRQKLAVCCLLGMGVFAGVAALVKTLQFQKGLHTADPTFKTYSLFLWAYLETSFVIVAGCVAPAKPAVDMLLTRKSIHSGLSKIAYESKEPKESGNSRRKRWMVLSSKNSSQKDSALDSFFDKFVGAQAIESALDEERGSTFRDSPGMNQMHGNKSYSIEHNDRRRGRY